MKTEIPNNALQLNSLITAGSELVVSLQPVMMRSPDEDEVLVRVDAAPLNPSDIGLLFGPADMSKVDVEEAGSTVTLKAPVAPAALQAVKGRLDSPQLVGHEGAGVVVAAGRSEKSQALLGKLVSVAGSGLYAQYQMAKASNCIAFPEGTKAEDAASAFVNPLTALGMVQTMRREGHTALVHTAAASNLGQMLNKICQKDGIPLVNVVRNEGQVALLKSLGARYICDSSRSTFAPELTEMIAATGATIAFDAIGGGKLAGQILLAMENAIQQKSSAYSRYGSNVHKQAYIYGGLNPGPVEIDRGVGMAWGAGGWLLFSYLEKIGAEETNKLRERVVAEIGTTFKSSYAESISLRDMLRPEVIAKYYRRSTGEKYLVVPNVAR